MNTVAKIFLHSLILPLLLTNMTLLSMEPATQKYVIIPFEGPATTTARFFSSNHRKALFSSCANYFEKLPNNEPFVLVSIPKPLSSSMLKEIQQVNQNLNEQEFSRAIDTIFSNSTMPFPISPSLMLSKKTGDVLMTLEDRDENGMPIQAQIIYNQEVGMSVYKQLKNFRKNPGQAIVAFTQEEYDAAIDEAVEVGLLKITSNGTIAIGNNAFVMPEKNKPQLPRLLSTKVVQKYEIIPCKAPVNALFFSIYQHHKFFGYYSTANLSYHEPCVFVSLQKPQHPDISEQECLKEITALYGPVPLPLAINPSSILSKKTGDVLMTLHNYSRIRPSKIKILYNQSVEPSIRKQLKNFRKNPGQAIVASTQEEYNAAIEQASKIGLLQIAPDGTIAMGNNAFVMPEKKSNQKNNCSR